MVIYLKTSKYRLLLCLADFPVFLFQGVENVEAYIPDAVWYDFETVRPSSRTVNTGRMLIFGWTIPWNHRLLVPPVRQRFSFKTFIFIYYRKQGLHIAKWKCSCTFQVINLVYTWEVEPFCLYKVQLSPLHPGNKKKKKHICGFHLKIHVASKVIKLYPWKYSLLAVRESCLLAPFNVQYKKQCLFLENAL